MNLSETINDPQPGQITARGAALGTITESMLKQRAREIAIIQGRDADYTPEDLEQARSELARVYAVESIPIEDAMPDPRWGKAGGNGHQAPILPASDEQMAAEELIQHGVEEATHDSMIAGSKYSAERDKT